MARYVSGSLVPLTDNGYILCREMRKRNPMDLDKFLLSHMVGGKMEPRERITETVSREWLEELTDGTFTKSEIKDFRLMIDKVEMERVELAVGEFSVNPCLILDVNKLNNKKWKKWYDYFNNVVDDFKGNQIIDSLFYWSGNTKEFETEPSTMLEMFVKKVYVPPPLKEIERQESFDDEVAEATGLIEEIDLDDF